MSTVTRIYESYDLNVGKYRALEKQAKLLGKIRTEVWERFGSLDGVGANHREIRDLWVETRDFKPLAAKAWKETLRETLRDTIDDIKLYEESAKERVRKAIFKKKISDLEKKKLYNLLAGDKWVENKYLCRMMRKHKKHGRTSVANQIIVEFGVYKQFEGKDGNTWIKIPSLVRGKMLSIPLNTKAKLEHSLRLILKDGVVYVHTTIAQRSFAPSGDQIIGVDQGYTEALADSKGGFHGKGFGTLMTKGTEKRNLRGKARNKLYQVAKKSKNNRKAKRIYKFNLGRKKLDRYNHRQYEQLRTKTFEAAHRVVDIANEVRAEDLSKSFEPSPWKSYNRRMSSWARRLLNEALNSVTKARGSRLRLVNAAYTSQMDSNTRRLEGRRVGDKFYHVNGDVSHADTNAAVNIEHRAEDIDISLYTSHKEVRAILLSRLTDNGGVSSSRKSNRPSRTPVTRRKRTLTESELTKDLTTQSCQIFL